MSAKMDKQKKSINKSRQQKQGVHKSGQAVNSSASTKVDRAKAGCPQKRTGNKSKRPQRWTGSKNKVSIKLDKEDI